VTDHPTRDFRFPANLAPDPDNPTQHLPAGVVAPERACLRCGQPMIPAYALANGYMTAGAIYICTHNEQLMLGPLHPASPCYVLVCPQCGYTELYTAYPDVLVKAEA
jgi:hypothetical protein